MNYQLPRARNSSRPAKGWKPVQLFDRFFDGDFNSRSGCGIISADVFRFRHKARNGGFEPPNAHGESIW